MVYILVSRSRREHTIALRVSYTYNSNQVLATRHKYSDTTKVKVNSIYRLKTLITVHAMHGCRNGRYIKLLLL